ncbi:alpha-2-macroglobulin family protein [Fundidesulfovibrio agrisoli]|uniref:alpha-2-macroglobulin family protein n=1 Tax=Fundidesulfovibrio agrisoli TaxID=2922717 RepID=UPI001FABE254|nr:MG2 domain-containing protein [Fundidesulfovibrio agrisoli]
MSQNGPSSSSSLKSLLIVVLLVVVGVQAYFLWGGRQPARESAPQTPATAPAPASAPAQAPAKSVGKAEGQAGGQLSYYHTWNRRDTLLIMFSKPVGDTEYNGPLSKPPFEMDPPLPGEWVWMGPYILSFKTAQKGGFNPSDSYTLTARPENFLPVGETLSGAQSFTLQGQALTVYDFSAESEPVAGRPGWYVIKGNIRFNADIKPSEMAAAMTLVDPKLGAAQPVPLEVAKDEGYGTSDLAFQSAPVQGEAKARMFTLLVDKNKAQSDKGLKLEKPLAYSVAVSHSDTLTVAAPKPVAGGQGGWELPFSAKVDTDALRRKLVIEPAVDSFSIGSERGRSVVLSGGFKPGASYTVTVPAGVTALNGAALAKDARFTFKVPDLAPAVGFANPGVFLPRSGSRNVALESVNAGKANVRIERVFRNNIFFSLSYYGDSTFESEGYEDVLPYLGDEIANFSLDLKRPRNEKQLTNMDVESRVKDSESGLYRITVEQAEGGSGRRQKWLLMTDLGIAAKRGQDDLLVWVASYKDTAPVAGARVKVVSTKNQVLFQGVTDKNGLWRTTGLSSLPPEREPFIVTVEKDSDYSFLHFDRFRTDMTGFDVSGTGVPAVGYVSTIWGERNIYRPGETVNGIMAVRDPQLKTPPAGMPVKLVWSDPQGREVAVENVKTDAQGMASFTRAIPAHFMTGSYLMEPRVGDESIGQYRFEVEDFKPDRISTSIEPGSERASPGADLAFTVESRYLFGAPAAGLAAEAQVMLMPAPFAPKGYEEYTFGDPDRSFETQVINLEPGNLDEQGRLGFKAAIPEGLKPPAALSAVITARVSEAGGRGVAARLKMPVDAYSVYPGLKKLGESGLTPGQAHAFDYVVVDGLGKPAKSPKLLAEFFEDRWQTVLRRADDGSLKYETKRDSRLVERRELPDPGEKGQVAFTPPKVGSYRVVLTDVASGSASQLGLWASGEGYNPWAMENPAKLELVPSKTDYLAGETARFQVRAPFAGRLLLTVESIGVMDSFVVDMPANTAEVSVPMKQGYSPNVYVTGVLVRKGADIRPGQAGRAFGTVSVGVAREAGRQNVTILAPELIKPKTKLTITAKADPGAVVTLAAVDEGILQLIAQKTPDPWGELYAKRSLGVTSFDTWMMLLPEVKALTGKSPAGGDEMGRYLRTESPQGDKSVAFWSGPLKADSQGRVQWTIDVPLFQGALRIMAVAVNGNRFGSSQHFTRVRSPLSILPTFPRFAQLGDGLRLPVTVRNDTDKDGSFQLALAASGAVSSTEQPRTLEIPKGKDRTVFLAVTAGTQEGTGALALSASGNGESYEVRSEFLVRSPLPAVSRIQAGANGAGPVEFGEEASGLLPGSVSRDLRLGRYPVVRFSGKLESLLGYPYGCLEQSVSRSFPLLYFANLARELEPEALAKASPESLVQVGISRVYSMQLPSGGFGLWPGAQREHAWSSVYAIHFLLEASKAGFQVTGPSMTQALDWLADFVKQEQPVGLVKAQAYGLYVLARAGKPDKGMMDHLTGKLAGKLGADAKALLAAAYVATGNAKGSDRLLTGLGQPVPAPAADDILDSPLRAQALMLAALVDAAPDNPATAQAAREVSRLLEAKGPCSTQEAGMAFMALGKLFARQQAGEPCTAQVMAGQSSLAAYDGVKTLTLKRIKAAGPLRIATGAECKPGALFYSLDTRGIPEASTYAPFAKGLEVKREFLGRDGKPLDVARLPQGTPVVVKTSVRSTAGPVAHVVLTQLLPSGLEVENPRLATTDKLPWMESEPAQTNYADYRADRVNVFLDLPGDKWVDAYTLCRAVIPGTYALPPVQAEAMYAPELQAGTELGRITVEGGQ